MSDWIEENKEDYYSKKSVLIITDIFNKIQSEIEKLSDILEISYDESLILLIYYKWKTDRLQEDWFENESKVRILAGILKPDNKNTYKTFNNLKLLSEIQGLCQICYVKVVERDELACGHTFCCNCWGKYIENLICEESIILGKCPNIDCTSRIPEFMIWKYSNMMNYNKYLKLKCENFIAMNPLHRFCPYPGCDYIADLNNSSVHEISCNCGYVFCFDCGDEAHRPILCSTVKDWNIKNLVESKNIEKLAEINNNIKNQAIKNLEESKSILWILANTKSCPSCNKPIEKNQGCNHMICYKNSGGCSFEFCWLCSGEWSEHGSITGGYYKCNKYENLKPKSKNILFKNEDLIGLNKDLIVLNEDLIAKIKTFEFQDNYKKVPETESEKYLWYFERFYNNSKAQILARDKQIPQIEKTIQQLHDIKHYPIDELKFLKFAIELVVRCRRVLKWTYVFGYYLTPGLEKNLFEHLQEKLEENTDYLHEHLEMPLDEFLDLNITDKSKFYHYKDNLTKYTQVTKEFFENVLDGIENGLTSCIL
ncbi:hypothetical protein SteCoe_7295 [Stentor coeruleus]|uniref:RBR-type E3 ubiquitin transferase n=1 Tax=Stentor coeruleus TaxID=5963 RepID=A0A1R2CMZ3_9CILI|nr:hypothetical protein SteCoe_7295 [Stentor coeruleus]